MKTVILNCAGFFNRDFDSRLILLITLVAVTFVPHVSCYAVDKDRCGGNTPKICYKYAGSNIGTKVTGSICCAQHQDCKPGFNGSGPKCLDYCATLGKETCGDPALVTSAQSSWCYNKQTEQCCLEYNDVLQGVGGKVAGPTRPYPKCCGNGIGTTEVATVISLTRATTVSDLSIKCCNTPRGPLPMDKLRNPLPITKEYYSGLAPATCGQDKTCQVEFSTGTDQLNNFTYTWVCK